MFDINNFVIDRIIRGVALSQKDDSVLFSINQIQNASLNCASESTDAVDAMGTPIATFYRAKSAEFSAENALFDMNLMATQLGTTKKVASSGAKILTPAMESFTAAGGTYTLKHAPKNAPTEIYALNGDSTFGTKYTKATAASTTAFSIADKTTQAMELSSQKCQMTLDNASLKHVLMTFPYPRDTSCGAILTEVSGDSVQARGVESDI